MATTAQVETATQPDRKPVVGGNELRGDVVLAGATSVPANDKERVAVERRRWKAAHYIVRFGRTASDPYADVLLEICGLTHEDGIPEPAPERQARLRAKRAAP